MSSDTELTSRLRNQVVNGVPHPCLPDVERLCDHYEAALRHAADLEREADELVRSKQALIDKVKRLEDMVAGKQAITDANRRLEREADELRGRLAEAREVLCAPDGPWHHLLCPDALCCHDDWHWPHHCTRCRWQARFAAHTPPAAVDQPGAET